MQSKDSAHEDHSNISVTPAIPYSSFPIAAVTEVSNAADNSVESLDAVSCSHQDLVTSSPSLDVESFRSNATDSLSSASVATKVAEVCTEPLLTSSESSTNLSQCSEEISIDRESLFGGQKWTDVPFRNCHNTSSLSLTELCDNKHSKTGITAKVSRKRKHDDEMPECGRLMFDKLPNYYTALSIPTRVTAGSAARSSSDLIKDFMCNERDPSPERKSCSVYDKLPAYYSSFTNSMRYDDSEHTLETDYYGDEIEAEVRFGRSSSSKNCELHDCKLLDESLAEGSCADDDHEKEKEHNTENVS